MIQVGFLGKHYCPICEKETNYHVSVVYRYGHIFWFPLFKWGTKYYLTCDVCEHGVKLEKDVIKPYLVSNPIPWLHRRGWIIAALGFTVFVLAINTC